MRNAFLNKDWGLYLLLLLATQSVPLTSQKVALEAGVRKQDEGMSTLSKMLWVLASICLPALHIKPKHMHCQPPEGVLSPQS